jgi:two-component system chemotaxis sensor kinase CheA
VTAELQLDGFIDDYFAECDEHLADARRHLLALEAALSSPGAERKPLEDLFRIFHSIKGISGMVELREAEQLAHEMESYLRALRQRETLLTEEGVDTLIDAAARLEQVVVARSRSSAIPSIADLEGRLAALVPVKAPRIALAHGESAPSPHAFRVRFRPSRELADQGLGVDAVRRRIAEHGTIVETTPHVGKDGTIEFVFLVTAASVDALATLGDMHAVVERVTPDARDRAIEPDASANAAGTSPAGSATSHFVRVDLQRLDELMQHVGDLVISRARLSDSLAAAQPRMPAPEWRAIQESAVTIDRQLRTLREGIMRVRLVPVGEIFGRMPLVVRDLARLFGRKVNVQISGASTEIDKYLVERMMDPILHLVRNCVAHGIESPDDRISAGKPAEGTIHLRAATAGDMVTIDIEDDGRGVDVEQVMRTAAASGIAVPPGPPTGATLLSVICSPGFSTRTQTDRAAGRGVGLAVVKSAVEQLAGMLSLDSVAGQGTRFAIQLPLTLAIVDALIARVGTETFAVPQSTVREVLEIDQAMVRSVELREVIPHRGAALPFIRLGRLFAIDTAPRSRLHVFVIDQNKAAVGIAVDRIIGQREIVVRPILHPLVRVEGVSGATDLGDGRVVLILDPAALGHMARRQSAAFAHARASAWRPRPDVRA